MWSSSVMAYAPRPRLRRQHPHSIRLRAGDLDLDLDLDRARVLSCSSCEKKRVKAYWKERKKTNAEDHPTLCDDVIFRKRF